jgi:hypothetical protein
MSTKSFRSTINNEENVDIEKLRQEKGKTLPEEKNTPPLDNPVGAIVGTVIKKEELKDEPKPKNNENDELDLSNLKMLAEMNVDDINSPYNLHFTEDRSEAKYALAELEAFIKIVSGKKPDRKVVLLFSVIMTNKLLQTAYLEKAKEYLNPKKSKRRTSNWDIWDAMLDMLDEM